MWRRSLISGGCTTSRQGVPRDFRQAAVWYRKAAEQGHAEAQHKLGRMYHQDIPQDFRQAAVWYRKAAEQGHPQAQWYLGDMYSEGLGVLQDFVEAHMWYNLAAYHLAATEFTQYQSEEAAKDRDAIAEQMTPKDLSEAQRRAREWISDAIR